MAVKKPQRVGQLVSGSRVSGLAIKAALNAAASKQIEAAGCRVGSGVVTFTGKTAFAQWQERGQSTRKGTGGWRSSAYQYIQGDKAHTYRSFRINYPAFASEAIFTRPEADLIAAYTLHETAHVLYSNITAHHISTAVQRALGNGPSVWSDCERLLGFPVSQSKKSLLRVWNGIEDARIENTVIRSGRAANAKVLFGRLLDKLTVDIGPTFNPTQKGSAPFALACLCREALGNGNAYTAKLLARIPEPKRSVYVEAMEAVKALPIGYDKDAATWEVAARFVMAFGACPEPEKRDEPEEDPIDINPEPEDEDNPMSEPDEQGEPDDSEFADDEEDDSGYNDMDDGRNDENGDGDEDDEPSEDGESGAGESDDKPADESESGEGDGEDADANVDGNPMSGDKDDGDDQGDSQSGEGSGSGASDGDNEFQNSAEHGEDIDGEPDIDDIFNKANRRCGADQMSDTMMNFERCDIGTLSNTRARIKAH